MSLNFLTAGESHGRALVGIIEGLPAGIRVKENGLMECMQRRKKGYGRGVRQKIEGDKVQVLSGVRFGKTLGTPIALQIDNQDFSQWRDIMSTWGEKTERKLVYIPRPGHADAVGGIKYQYNDLRNSLERASARETAMRVALGYFARKFLEQAVDIHIFSRVIRIGNIVDTSTFNEEDWGQQKAQVDRDPMHCLSKKKSEQMQGLVDEAKKKKDSLGGEFEVYAKGLPVGLGSYGQWFRKMEAKIGSAFLSLNGIKSVEIGLGKKSSQLWGSQVHDPIYWDNKEGLRFSSNHAGGMLAGVSNGMPVIIRASMKPIATLMKPLPSFQWITKERSLAHIERADYCAAPAASIIGESLLSLVLADLCLEKFGGDSLQEVEKRVELWCQTSLS